MPSTPVEVDDLTRIEGIGPAIAGHLNAAGIMSYSQLASAGSVQIREILDAVGGYGAHDATTWCDQAQLAAVGAWTQLQDSPSAKARTATPCQRTLKLILRSYAKKIP